VTLLVLLGCTDYALGGKEAATGCGPSGNPWSYHVRWRWEGVHAFATPAVADLDGDGDADVVLPYADDAEGWHGGGLARLDGATGAVRWTVDGGTAASGVALGDVDGDGTLEIATIDGGGVDLRNADGSLRWEADGAATLDYPTLADLDGDGDLDVVTSVAVFDGPTGAQLAPFSGEGAAVAVGDLDGDDVPEVLLGNEVFDAHGILRFTCGPAGTAADPTGAGATALPWDADGDGRPEVLVTSGGTATLCDGVDGAERWRHVLAENADAGGVVGCVADLDGDERTEVALPLPGTVEALDGDGVTLWSVVDADASGSAGCTAWDLDGDGAAEVLLGDETDFLVLDGATGALRMRDVAHASVTLQETPAVADVDGDGVGEILFASNGTDAGLTVLAGDWAAAPAEFTERNWPNGEVFRAQPAACE
jgi:hypothetical protein